MILMDDVMLWSLLLITSIVFMIASFLLWIAIRIFLVAPRNKQIEALYKRINDLQRANRPTARNKKPNGANSRFAREKNKDTTQIFTVHETDQTQKLPQSDEYQRLGDLKISKTATKASTGMEQEQRDESMAGISSKRVIHLEEIHVATHSDQVPKMRRPRKLLESTLKTARSPRKKKELIADSETGTDTTENENGSSSKPIEEGNTSYEGASSTISGSDTEQIENDSTKLED